MFFYVHFICMLTLASQISQVLPRQWYQSFKQHTFLRCREANNKNDASGKCRKMYYYE